MSFKKSKKKLQVCQVQNIFSILVRKKGTKLTFTWLNKASFKGLPIYLKEERANNQNPVLFINVKLDGVAATSSVDNRPSP